jgi:porin
VSQWGANLHVDVRKGMYVQAGAYEVNPRNLENDFFLGHFDGATGVLVPVEAGWTRGGDEGNVGSYKLGGWISTADGDDLLLDSNRQPSAVTGTAPLRRSSRYGVYASVQQQLSGTSKDGKALTGFGMFANVTFADRATTLTDNQVALGLFYKGLAPSLPGDVIGLGLARTNVNGRAEQADRLAGTRPRDAEYAAELYYSVSPTEWLVVQPNVQWIHQPGGVRGAKDVGVLGLKAAITL